MKRITLMYSLAFMTSLSTFADVGDKITSLEELSNYKCYTIDVADKKPNNNNKVRGTWYYASDDPTHLWSTTNKTTEINTTDPNQQFAFLKSGSGQYYVYSVAGEKFLSYDKSTSNASVALLDKPLDNNAKASILTSQKTDFQWVIALSDNNQGTHHIGLSPDYHYGVITFWNDLNDGGNCISIVEAAEFNPEEALEKIEQFEACYNEENLAAATEANSLLQVTGTFVGGYDPTLIAALNNACGGDNKADIYDAATEEFKTAMAALKASTPVKFSNDKVYKIQNLVASNGYLISRTETDNSQVFSSAKTGEATEALPIIENSDKWQVYTDDGGNTFLYNQGTQKYVEYDAENDLWKLTNEATYTNIQKNESKGMGVYSIQDPNYTGQLQYMHVNIGQSDISGVKGWETSADASNFYFIETEGTAIDLASIALEKIKSEAQELINSYSSEYEDFIGYYSSASIEALRDALQTEDATVASIQNAIDQATASRKTIQADKYYRIQNAMTFDDGEAKFIYENSDGNNIAWGTGTQNAAELWKLVATDEGTYYITSANTGKQIQLVPGAGSGNLTNQSTTPFTLESKDNSYTYGLVAYSASDKATLVLQKGNSWGQTATSTDISGNFVGTYNDFSATIPTKWNIIETRSVMFQIGETGYATAWFPYAVTIPSDVEAYYVSRTQDGKAVLTKVNDVIPAKSGVILKGTQGTHKFAITDIQTPSITGNCLTGTSIATRVENNATVYVLAQPEGKEIGFYQLDNSEQADRTIGANKAYLTIAGTAGIKAFTFDFGDTTGIDNPETAFELEEYYDLQGRRVMNPTKGIYVTKSGKKVLFTK